MVSLLNWLEGAFAQVNPFDNGEDYGSVMRRKQREEQQRRAQQPQQPQPRQQSQRAPLAQPLARQDFTQPQTPALQPSNTPASLSRNSVINRPNNLRIGDFEYTQNPDGTFTNTKSGEKRTSEQIKRLQQIEGQFQERQDKINRDQAWGTVGDIVSAPVKVGLGIGKGATDLATGQVGDWGNRVADFGSAAAEVAREVTGENQRVFEQQQKTSAEYMRMANSFMQRANNARTPAEKQRYIDQARSLWSASDDVMGQAQNDINRGLEATDPKKTISNAGMTMLDVATAGKGKAILEGVNLGQKVGTQSLKRLGKNTLITAAEGAGIGGTYGGLATMQDPNAELIDYAQNIGTGLLLGAGVGVGAQVALPVAGVVSKKAIDSGVKGAQATKKAANNARPSVIARQDPRVVGYDDTILQLQQRFDSEPNTLVRHQLNQAITAARQEQAATFNQVKRELTQGGYIAGPKALGFGKAKQQGRVFDGVDGKPRFEVDDSGAKLKFTQTGKGDTDIRNKFLASKVKPDGSYGQLPLSEVIDHPRLFEQYPDLKDLPVVLNQRSSQNGERAFYSPKGDYISINAGQYGEYSPTLDGTLLHEIQHAIQEREGFARGGSPEMNTLKKRLIEKYKPKVENLPAYKALKTDKERAAFTLDFVKMQNPGNSLDDVLINEYRKFAGEAEARAVQARMNMPMSERYVVPKTKAGDYVGSHQAPTRGDGDYHAPASDVTSGAGMFPDDIYTDPQAYRYYGHGGDAKTIAMDKKSIELIRAIKDNPDAEVTMYRAVPKGKATDVNPGDWVTLNKDYAQMHNSSQFDGKGVILEKKVKADELYTDGNSIHEFGYDPRPQPRSTFYDSLDVPKEDLIIRNGEGKAMSLSSMDDTYIREQAATYTSKSQLIDEITDSLWQANKKGQGVDIAYTKTGELGIGSDAYAGTRISNNSPFYQAYYEQYGKKPTKVGIKREVEAFLDGADNSVKYELPREMRDIADLVDDRTTAPVTDASSSATKKVTELPEQRKSVKEPLQKQSIEVPRTTQGKTSRLAQESDQQIPSPDNKAQIDRTYTDNTPEIDTKQYVKEMNKSQKDATKGLSGLGKKTDDFKEKFIDDLAPIEDRLKDAIDKGATVDPKDHISYQLDRSRRSEGIMHAYVRDNGLDKIIQGVPNTKEFDQYLIARHAKELGEDVATGRDVAKDAALVKQLDSKYAESAKELYKYNQKLLDTSVEYGLISKAAANKLKKQYPEYVPFNRIFNEDELAHLYGGSGKGNASLSSQSVVKKIKGSNRAIASPLNSIIDKTRVVVEQGERNRAAKMLADYRDLPGNPFNLKEIPKGETIGSRSTISYLDKGVKRTFETDKSIADAAKNMTRQEIGMWGRIASVPARLLRGGATTVNVGFAGANVVKDVVGAAINSKHPFRIADPMAFGKALSSALRHNGKHYQELMREGVAGTSFDMYRNPLKSNVNELRSHKNLATRAAYNATHPSQWYRTLENTIGRSEDFGRALQYYSNKSGFEKKLGKNSKSAKILAADQARHNSTNFFRHGSYGKGINLAIPYWNAGVQGARIQTRRIVERPVQTLAKIGFVIAAPSAMIAMNNYANEKNRQVMEDIPQYEKDSNIIIVGSDARKNQDTGRWEGVYKIPVPPQHIGVHKTIQDAVRASVTGEPMDIMADLGRVTEDYTTINPTDAEATANRYIPQALKLVAEPMTNTNFYTGNKIVPDSQKNLPAADQYGEYTSGTAKTIGKIANISPRQIDNAIRTAMGGAGQNAVNIIDTGLANSGVIDKKQIRGKSVLDSITSRFYGAASINPSEAAEKKFDQLKEQIIETDSYKNASTYDKTRMLNRLERDISDVSWYMSGKSDKDTKLTKKQSSLLIDGFNTDNYTNLDTKSASKVEINESIPEKHRATLKTYYDMDADKRESWFAEKNDNEYKYWKAKYENDKANGEISDIEDVKRKRMLYKDKVGSKFSKDTRDLYSLSKADIAAYLSKAKNGEKIAKELLKYDRALYDAGLSKYMKFRYGFGSASGRRGGRGGSRVTGVTEAKARIALARKLNGMKAPATSAKQEKPSVGKAEYKKTPLRKYTVTKAGKTGQPLRITTRKA